MAIEPKPGLVVRYDFLWKEQSAQGQEHGTKDRPCAIILAAQEREDGSRDVILAPITHTPPAAGESAIPIPQKVAEHLGLDDGQSWIKTHEVNTDRWERDLIPHGVTPARPGVWEFGQLPHGLAKQAFEQVRDNSHNRNLANVKRGEEPSRDQGNRLRDGDSVSKQQKKTGRERFRTKAKKDRQNVRSSSRTRTRSEDDH